MPVLAFTFGSFGDIATILQLAWTIRRTLGESAGSLTQIQALIADIDVFTRALQQIKCALESRASGSVPVPEDLLNGIAHALERCFVSLVRIKQRIASFNAQLAGAVGKNVVREYWAVLGWEILGGRREVEALRMRLADQITVIQTLLAAAQCRNLEGIKTAAKAHSQNLSDIRNDAREAHLHVGDMFTSMRELCIRLSATSAAFTFFDSSGAQILPLAVLPMPLAKKLQLLSPHDYPWRTHYKAYIRKGHVYFRLSVALNPSTRGHTMWHRCRKTSVLGTDVVYPGRPYFEMTCFLHWRDGNDRRIHLQDVSVFISPVYGKFIHSKEDTLQSAPVPAASALISGLVRAERKVMYEWILDDLVHEMGGIVNTKRYRKLRRTAAV